VALQGKKINDLHIYATAKPGGAIGFCNMPSICKIVLQKKAPYINGHQCVRQSSDSLRHCFQNSIGVGI